MSPVVITARPKGCEIVCAVKVEFGVLCWHCRKYEETQAIVNRKTARTAKERDAQAQQSFGQLLVEDLAGANKENT